MRNTVTTLQKCKDEGRKFTMLTAYDYSTAKLIDEAGIDTILVGDSLGMTILGYENTLSVTMEDMIHHTKPVVRGAQSAFVVADMPYLSYHLSVQQAVENAGRLITEGGAQAVKLEGGAQFCSEVEAMTRASIPVVGHIGLTPQSINAFGGFKVQGKSEEAARRIVEDAKALEAAGAVVVLMECIPAPVAKLVTESLRVPTIGIGCGPDCTGQVLVYQDMLGMFSGLAPKFVRRFAEVGELMIQGFKDYDAAVKDGTFPAPEHTFRLDDDVLKKLY